MRVYVATKFTDWPKAKAAAELLEAAGHEVTSRWIGVAEDVSGDTGEGGQARRHKEAWHDIEDMESSSAIIALVPEEGGCGMWAEVGFMLSRKLGQNIYSTPYTRVIGVGPIRRRLIFGECHEVVEEYDTIEQAIEALEES